MEELKQYLFNRVDALKEQRSMCNPVTQQHNVALLGAMLNEIVMLAEKMRWFDLLGRIYAQPKEKQ